MNKVFRVGLTEQVNIPWGYLPGERPFFYHLLILGSQNDFQINEVDQGMKLQPAFSPLVT